MLKSRLLTAAILIPLVVWGLLTLPLPALALLSGVFVVLGGWEWAGLCGWNQNAQRAAYAAATAGVLALLYRNFGQWHGVLILVAAVWWLVALTWVIQYQRGHEWRFPVWLKTALGLLVLVPAWAALLVLLSTMHYGPYMALYVLVLIWSADSAAYFAGRRWGKHKLAARVSPGKTWEGVAGASLAGALVALGFALWWNTRAAELPTQAIPCVSGFVVLSVLVVWASVLGDLAESLFKRQAGVKDSGTLLPGHGGVLDRIDSLTAALPLFVLGLGILMGFKTQII